MTIEYLTFNNRKLPFAITMSVLMEFKIALGRDFRIASNDEIDFDELYKSVLTILILGLRKGYTLAKVPWYKSLLNLIQTGSKIGINQKDYVKLLDLEYANIVEMIPRFFAKLSENDKKK